MRSKCNSRALHFYSHCIFLNFVIPLILVFAHVNGAFSYKTYVPTIHTCSKVSELTITLPRFLMDNEIPTEFYLIEGNVDCENSDFCPCHPCKVSRISLLENPDEEDILTDSIFAYFHSTTGTVTLTCEDGGVTSGSPYHSLYRDTSQYCVKEFVANASMTIKYCDIGCQNVSSGHVLVPKCCPLGQVIDMENQFACTKADLAWKPTVFNPVLNKSREIQLVTSGSDNLILHYFSNMDENCSYNVYTERQPSLNFSYSTVPLRFRLSTRGSVWTSPFNTPSSQPDWTELNETNYFCMDGLAYDEEKLENVLIICFDSTDNANRHRNAGISVWYTIIFSVAIFFLGITVIIYLLLWSHQNIHGYTFMSYSISLTVLFLLLTILYNQHGYPFQKKPSTSTVCLLLAFGVHFFFLFTFSWLTVISFDIWWTFRNSSRLPVRAHRRYFYYLTFACVLPISIILVGVFLDTYNKSNNGSSTSMFISPGYNTNRCSIRPEAEGWYIYYPAGMLLVCNLIFYMMTVTTLLRVRKETSVARRSRSHKDSRTVKLFGKLFILMGISWVLEMITWMYRETMPESQWAVAVTDAINLLLQAVAIFYNFVWKCSAFEQLWNKYPSFRPFLSLFVRAKCCSSPDESRDTGLMYSRNVSLRSRISEPRIAETTT